MASFTKHAVRVDGGSGGLQFRQQFDQLLAFAGFVFVVVVVNQQSVGDVCSGGLKRGDDKVHPGRSRVHRIARQTFIAVSKGLVDDVPVSGTSA